MLLGEEPPLRPTDLAFEQLQRGRRARSRMLRRMAQVLNRKDAPVASASCARL
jgi:hypothetical protein